MTAVVLLPSWSWCDSRKALAQGTKVRDRT